MFKEVHKKINPEYFSLVSKNLKTFEIRLDEDNIQPFDILYLHEWENGNYTGMEVHHIIKYVLRNVPEYGLMEGYCIVCW